MDLIALELASDNFLQQLTSIATDLACQKTYLYWLFTFAQQQMCLQQKTT